MLKRISKYLENLSKYPKDWLAAVEILEISEDDTLNNSIRTYLNNTESDDVIKGLIKDSLSLLE